MSSSTIDLEVHQCVNLYDPLLNWPFSVFGFAPTDGLLREGSANAGVRDQRLAIEWVHKKIAAFGGDPERITIHGQSSGGLAVGMQILAYGNSRPYPSQQAICQSQALEPGITGIFSRHATWRVSAEVGCTYAPFDSAANLDYLRGIPMEVRLLLFHGAQGKWWYAD